MKIPNNLPDHLEIETYNQYGLRDDKDTGPCPVCGPDRKPQNQKKPTAKYYWDTTGIGTCRHCDQSFQLHKVKRKNSVKEYSKPKANENTTIAPRVLSYFESRGISGSTLQKAKITTSPGWIEFNYYAYGQLVNRKSRNGKKQFRLEKNCEMVWYNHDALFDNDDIIIVEGEIDALSYMECGKTNVLSVPNGAKNYGFLDTSIDLFDNVSKVYLSIDNDEAGQELQEELIRRLGAEKCFIITLPGAKDANEYLVHAGVDGLLDAFNSAEQVPLEGVKTLADVEDLVDSAILEGFKKGYTCGLDPVDEIFSISDRQFCVVTGVPSSGKSDFVDQFCMGLNHRYGWKVAYASPENYPIHFHAHKILRKEFDGMPEDGDIGSARLNEAKERCSENYFFMDLHDYSLETVLKKAQELVKRKGIKLLVIDPYNKVKLKSAANDSINEYTNKYLNAIDEFCRQNNVFCFLVAHPVKLKKNDDGQYPIPSFYDVKGGGEMYDMSPNGLAVHRDYTRKTTIIKVLKVKFQFQGENNGECELKWDPGSGRYKESEVAEIEVSDLPW